MLGRFEVDSVPLAIGANIGAGDPGSGIVPLVSSGRAAGVVVPAVAAGFGAVVGEVGLLTSLIEDLFGADDWRGGGSLGRGSWSIITLISWFGGLDYDSRGGGGSIYDDVLNLFFECFGDGTPGS